MDIQPDSFVVFLVRMITGILFFFQGYDKFFRMGIPTVINTIAPSYRKVGVPDRMIRVSAYFTSFLELVGGILLIAGLFRYEALYALSLDLIIVSAGMSLLSPTWDLQHVFARLILIVFLLVYGLENDLFAFDMILK